MRRLPYALIALSAAFLAIGAPALATTYSDGEFFSYDQNIWGADPADGGAAAGLQAHFFDVYTTGIFEVGNPVPGGRFMEFSSPDSLLHYLPQAGTAAALAATLADPTSSTSGVFGGQVAALKLNIDFSDAGLFYDLIGSGATMAHPAGVAFGDLLLTGQSGALSGLNGATVRQVLDIANVLLGGGSASPYTVADFSDLLTPLNAAFQGGYHLPFADDHLVLPDTGGTGAVPEPASWVMMISGFAVVGSTMRRRRVHAGAA